MKTKVTIFFGICMVGLALRVAWADTLVLKTGQIIDGTIVEQTADTIRVNFEGVELVYPLSDIDTVNGVKPETTVTEPATPDAKAAATDETPVVISQPSVLTDTETAAETVAEPSVPDAPVVEAPAESAPAAVSDVTETSSSGSAAISEATVPPAPESQEPKASEPAVEQPPAFEIPHQTFEDGILSSPAPVEPTPFEVSVPEPMPDDQPPAVLSTQPQVAPGATARVANPFAHVPPAVVMTVMAVVFVLSIAIYIFYALCLQIIANKTNQSPSWLAWIPIANLFLMCKIAALRYWWVMGIFLGFIPFVGWLLAGVWSGYVWFKIAVARNKPGWVGVLAVIPLVNLAIIGYLAFTDAPAQSGEASKLEV